MRVPARSGCSRYSSSSSGKNQPRSLSYFAMSRYRTSSTWPSAKSATSATSVWIRHSVSNERCSPQSRVIRTAVWPEVICSGRRARSARAVLPLRSRRERVSGLESLHLDRELTDRHEHRGDQEASNEPREAAREHAGQRRGLIVVHAEELRESVDSHRDQPEDHDGRARALRSEFREPAAQKRRQRVQHDLTGARGGPGEHGGDDTEVREDVHRCHALVDRHLVAIQPKGAIEQLVALRVADRVDDPRVERERRPDVLVIDDVRAADLIGKGTGRHEERGDEQGGGPSNVHDEHAEERFAPGEPGPEGGRHGRRYPPFENKPSPPNVRATSLREPRRAPVERRLARRGTEMVRLASVDGAARGPLRLDHHPAHRIFLHGSPPTWRPHSCGWNPRKVIEVITTGTELKPMAAPAMIGFSTIPIPAQIPAAIG